MFKKLKELTELIMSEDYMTLEDKFIEIGVLTYLAQAHKLNSNREKKLRELILNTTESVKQGVAKWACRHGLFEEIQDGLNMPSDELDEYRDELFEVMDKGTEHYLQIFNEYARDEITIQDLYEDLNEKHPPLVGLANGVFRHIEEEEIEEALKPYIEYEEYDDDGETRFDYYFNGDDTAVRDIIISLMSKAVRDNDSFMDILEDNIESIKKVEDEVDTASIDKLVLDFDRLKDLTHYTGSLYDFYTDEVNFNYVNDTVEEKVKSLK